MTHRRRNRRWQPEAPHRPHNDFRNRMRTALHDTVADYMRRLGVVYRDLLWSMTREGAIKAAEAQLRIMPEPGVDQWRRWWKANRKYQRRLRALRQAGMRALPGMPTSLRREMVP